MVHPFLKSSAEGEVRHLKSDCATLASLVNRAAWKPCWSNLTKTSYCSPVLFWVLSTKISSYQTRVVYGTQSKFIRHMQNNKTFFANMLFKTSNIFIWSLSTLCVSFILFVVLSNCVCVGAGGYGQNVYHGIFLKFGQYIIIAILMWITWKPQRNC